MQRERRDEAPGLVERRAHERADAGGRVQRPLRLRAAAALRVCERVDLARTHRAQRFGPEVRHREAPDQARRAGSRVIAADGEVVRIGFDLGVSAAVGAERLAELARHRRHDLSRVLERAQVGVEGAQEAVNAGGVGRAHAL